MSIVSCIKFCLTTEITRYVIVQNVIAVKCVVRQAHIQGKVL